jgi:syntaxin-binding protein 1
VPQDRLRLIALYVINKYGILRDDIIKLLLHAQLPQQDEGNIHNLELLGARVTKTLKDKTEPPPPIIPKKMTPVNPNEEEISISRFKPVLKSILDEHIAGTLDPVAFPYVNPEAAPLPNDPANISSASLRSAKPTWAKGKLGSVEPRQRILVFMAGGATYSEARTCYEASEQTSRDVVLVTSHMLTPALFLRQVADLSADRRQLGLPVDKPARRAPAHLFEEDKPKPAPMVGAAGGLPSGPGRAGGPRPMAGGLPTDKMAKMNLNGGGSSTGSRPSGESSKIKKDYEQAEKKKKKGLFGRS